MNWIELRALHELYRTGTVAKNNTLSGSAVIRYLENSVNVLQQTFKKLQAMDSYYSFYEANYLVKYQQYEKFLQEIGTLKPQSRFELSDIDILMAIDSGRRDGSLEFLREQIISSNESLRGVSLMFFKHEKYLLNRPSLVEVLKKILDVESFSNEKDQQYIYKLECHGPRAVVLCENLDFLTKPDKPRKHRIELWYAGGKNIKKLVYANPRGLPIFYSCDWDYDGLLIYLWVKKIIPAIQILSPNGSPRSIEETEHDSLWPSLDDGIELSGYPSDAFNAAQKELIQRLISANLWIIEESNDLIAMLAGEKIIQ
jgi:hypothetical protein